MDKNYEIPWSHVIIKKATVTGLLDKVPARPITKNTTVLRFVTPWKLVNTDISETRTVPSVYHEVGGSKFLQKYGT
jgi:hypothetical protein